MKPKQVLLLIETSRRFGRDLIKGISQYARERADWLFDFEDRGLLEDLPVRLKNWRGNGVIARSSSQRLFTSISALGCPVIELLGDGHHFPAEVVLDEHQTAQLAVLHLQKQGYDRLGFYAFANSWWSEARRIGFEEAAAEAGLEAHVFDVAQKGCQQPYPSWRHAYQSRLIRWLDQLPKPIGIWAVQDSQAVRIVEACRELRLQIPRDVGLLGTGNEDVVCSLMSPSLSSIELNATQVGYQAARCLDVKMRGKSRNGKSKSSARRSKTTFKPLMVQPDGVMERDSTNLLAVLDPELHQTMELIRRQASQGLTVESLAEQMLLSRSTLERRFRKFYHCSPADEINRHRIERAKALLRDTAWPVHRVGREMGFESPENFVRFFKRLVGQTPLRYRNDMHS